MGIVSISLNEKNLEALDDIRSAFGLNGRSEAMRTAINIAMGDIQEMKDMAGSIEGVLIVVRRDHADPWMGSIQAEYETEIKTQMHSHLKDHKCLEVMVISGNAENLSSMLKEIYATNKADYVKFIRS
jgi:CopG family transcriptional regulator, nickel-responsive regulator